MSDQPVVNLGATESAVLVPVPGAEALVGGFRRRFDRAAVWGVPAHVTVLYPFVAPRLLDEQTLSSVTRTCRDISAIDVTFGRLAWFDDRVLYLAPEPDRWFLRLTQEMVAAFPQCPPYGGIFDDVVPHLTVGDNGGVEELREVERCLAPLLPLRVRVDRVWVMAGSAAPQSWHVVHEVFLRSRPSLSSSHPPVRPPAVGPP